MQLHAYEAVRTTTTCSKWSSEPGVWISTRLAETPSLCTDATISMALVSNRSVLSPAYWVNANTDAAEMRKLVLMGSSAGILL
jgi:hypothetical protein